MFFFIEKYYYRNWTNKRNYNHLKSIFRWLTLELVRELKMLVIFNVRKNTCFKNTRFKNFKFKYISRFIENNKKLEHVYKNI